MAFFCIIWSILISKRHLYRLIVLGIVWNNSVRVGMLLPVVRSPQKLFVYVSLLSDNVLARRKHDCIKHTYFSMWARIKVKLLVDDGQSFMSCSTSIHPLFATIHSYSPRSPQFINYSLESSLRKPSLICYLTCHDGQEAVFVICKAWESRQDLHPYMSLPFVTIRICIFPYQL